MFKTIKTIDRYIFRELIDPFFFGLGAFTSILSASMVLFELVRQVVIKGMAFHVAVQLFIFRLPGVMVYIFPMATLLAALLAFSRLSGDSEIIAFRASGLSIYRLIVPVLVLGLIVSLVTFLFYEVVAPQGNRAAKNILAETAVRKGPRIQKNMFVPELKRGKLKRIFYAERLRNGIMEGVIVGEFEKGKLTQLINAKEAEWQEEKERWLFKKGIIYLLSETGEYKHLIRFDEEYVAIKYTPKDFMVGDKSPEEMNIKELRDYIELKKKMGVDVRDYIIQLHMKTSIPFACLVFALLGAPLGLTPRRTGSGVGLGISIIIVFLYYVMISFSMAIGILGWIPGVLAAWLPNIMTGGIGYYILRRSAT